MVHFELVNENTVPQRRQTRATRAVDSWANWADTVVAQECAKAGARMPVIKHRKARATNAKRVTYILDRDGVYSDSAGNRYRKIVTVVAQRERESSSGVCRYFEGTLTINRGTDFEDFQYVVLHELAHWLCGPQAAHGVRFWKRCYALCESYSLDMAHVYSRAKNYKKRAATAAMPPERD